MGTKTEVREEHVSVGWRWVTHTHKNDEEGSLIFQSPYVFRFCYKARGLLCLLFLFVEYKLILTMGNFKVIGLNNILKYISFNSQ